MKHYTGVYELSEDNNLTDALGITEGRFEELKNLTVDCVDKCERISETFQALWNAADHPNEFAWMVFVYGTNSGIQQYKKDMQKLKDLLGDSNDIF
jgi:hypothetical protein